MPYEFSGYSLNLKIYSKTMQVLFAINTLRLTFMLSITRSA